MHKKLMLSASTDDLFNYYITDNLDGVTVDVARLRSVRERLSVNQPDKAAVTVNGSTLELVSGMYGLIASKQLNRPLVHLVVID
jgi:hypothetical protein